MEEFVGEKSKFNFKIDEKSNKLILIITSSRGDYDILKPIIKKSKNQKN